MVHHVVQLDVPTAWDSPETVLVPIRKDLEEEVDCSHKTS